MKYIEMKRQNGEELNKFEGIFFAFSSEQFEQGLTKIGLTKSDTDKIYSLGAGGYILKTRSQDFGNMLKRHKDELKTLKKEEKELIEALVYELGNHEYCITYDTRDALEALSMEEGDIEPAVLKKAIKKYMEGVIL